MKRRLLYKKINKKFLSFTLCTILIFNISLVAKAESSIESKLAPYQLVIDKINDEYNASISIQDEDLEEVYNNIKDMSVEEFEKQTRKDYLEAMDCPQEIIIDKNTYGKTVDITSDESLNTFNYKFDKVSKLALPMKIKSKVKLYSIIAYNVTQTYSWSQGSVYIRTNLDATTSGELSYAGFVAAGYTKLSTNHFRGNDYSVSFINSNRNCNITYYGALYSGSGLKFGLSMTVKVTFTAGAGSIGEII